MRKKKKGGSRSQSAQKHATDHPLFIRLDMDAILQETSVIGTSASRSYGTPNVRNATVVFAAPRDGRQTHLLHSWAQKEHFAAACGHDSGSEGGGNGLGACV
ncbi:hypothetical protein GCM10009575_029230 [Streptomyces rhizosphaericus]|uniref:Uncharacterized protein n=1 Tax=Streptomyces rhizosphaericus TaxID=114699 RepID=A0ABN1PIH9_9ACTN